jgi:hypothetical protein
MPDARRPYRVPGGTATAGAAVLASLLMIYLSLYLPYRSAQGRVPVEWAVFLVWCALGVACWGLSRRARERVVEQERRAAIIGETIGAAV